ncbi:hypothetical protein [Fodinicola acaciae]|uniref:hypothetical protein n=1 Tax=Fodinicola acaciae TaxID=2681555 RepID=UPI0013CF534F|nr:hypothetical protein [Fodinicola acaciae]
MSWWGLRPFWWFVLAAGLALAWASTYAHSLLITPDTGSYLWHSLYYGGTSQPDALCQAHHFLQQQGAIKPAPCPTAPDPFNESFQRSRLLYPLLSVPFVWLFGPAGILAVPLLASVVAVVGLTVLLVRWVPEPVAVCLSLAAYALPPLVTFTLSGLTEGPVLALEVAVLLLLPLTAADERADAPEPASRATIVRWVAIAALVTAIGLTRQATPVIGGIVALGWLSALIQHRRRHGGWTMRTGWTGPLLATIAGNLISLGWLAVNGASQTVLAFRATGVSSWPEALQRYPGLLHSIARAELLTAWKYPLVLLALLLAAVWFVRRPLSRPSMMLAGAALGVIVLQVASPYATFLRIESAAVPVILIAVAHLFRQWTDRRSDTPTESASEAGFADGVQVSG